MHSLILLYSQHTFSGNGVFFPCFVLMFVTVSITCTTAVFIPNRIYVTRTLCYVVNLEFWKLFYYYPLITKCNNQCANVQYNDFFCLNWILICYTSKTESRVYDRHRYGTTRWLRNMGPRKGRENIDVRGLGGLECSSHRDSHINIQMLVTMGST